MKKKILLLLIVLLLSSCAMVQKIAMNQLTGMLSSDANGGAVTAFLQDDDPELVADSLPPLMKILEMLIQSNPEIPELQYTTGMIFVMYANAFVQTPASMLDPEQYKLQADMTARAKRLYRRGRDYILAALDLKYPGFRDMINHDELDAAFSMLKPEDAASLYWCGAGWVGMFSCDPLDFKVNATTYRGVAMILKALELDESYSSGAGHDICLQLYMSMPALIITVFVKSPAMAESFNNYYAENGIGIDYRERAIFHFNRSLEISEGKSPAPYIAYATTISVIDQNAAEYEEMLQTVLDINPDENLDSRLLIIIYQQKAEWLLRHIDNYIIE